ncbi:MAG: hypothetical protein M3Q03_03530 [Chloroflexota bacterium]|nr:hypothetical protein [Chloroflexota bacterium]
MKFTLIDRGKAPAPPTRATTGRVKESDRLVAALVPGRVARVEPAEGESLRGLKASITRAAARTGQKVRAWDHDGALYVELA